MVEFVGFAPSPKVPPGSTLLTHEKTFSLRLPHKDAAATILAKAPAATWLGTPNSWQLTVGAKLTFANGLLAGQTATVTQSNLPKEFAMIADSFGMLHISVAKAAKNSSTLHLVFSRWCLEADQAAFNDLSDALLRGAEAILKEVLND